MPLWVMILCKTLIAVVVIFTLTKLLGKRQISQLSLFEYITGITIGNLTAYISIEESSNWYLGIIALVAWVTVSLGIEKIELKSKKIRNFVDGSATLLIKNGRVLEKNLKKEKLTSEELLEQLRKKNIFKLSEVEFAVIEPDGQINTLLKKQHLPLTADILGIDVTPESEPQVIIMDGKVMDKTMATAGINQKWLDKKLNELGITPENVFLAQVDTSGELYIDLYEDQATVNLKPKQKPTVVSQLKKCGHQLQYLANTSQNAEIKKIYENCYIQLQQISSDINMIQNSN
jgi:uncharacterized membrane protein YcaP (DUF421 family)